MPSKTATLLTLVVITASTLGAFVRCTTPPPWVATATPDGGPPSADGGSVDAGQPAPLHRLRVGQHTTADGFKSVNTQFFDTVLNAPCHPALDSKKTLRCFPVGTYKPPVYRGKDPKTGACLEEVFVGPAGQEKGLVGIGLNGAFRIHQMGVRLAAGDAIWTATPDPKAPTKTVCTSQKMPADAALYAVGADLTPSLAEMQFQWVDTP